MNKLIILKIQQVMTNTKTNKKPSIEEVEAAIRHYCLYHLKPEDLKEVPELRRFISNNNGYGK